MGEVIRRTSAGRFIGYYLRYIDADGRRKQRASHQPTLAEARRMLVEIEARIARGLVGIPERKPPAPTMSELAERYLGEYNRPRIKDIAKYRRYVRTALARALPFIGELPSDALKAADVCRLRDGLLGRHAPGSARLTLDVLRALYGWAVREGIVAHNPLRGVEGPPREASLDFLSAAEARAVVAAAERQAAAGGLDAQARHAAVLLTLHLGLRKGEVLGLRWRDLDLEHRRVTVARSFAATPKSGKPRYLRLPAVTVPILTAWRARCPTTPAGLVFPVHRARQGQAGAWGLATPGELFGLPQLLAEAGCRPLSRPWHALRHTFASHFIMQGGNILSLQKILGHGDIKMTLVYAHLAPDFLGEELDRLKF